MSKLPSSLKWLIDKRARLDAEIRKTEASLARARELINDLENLKESLAAIDRAFELHEIKVDVNLIRPVKSKYVRINLPYGELSRSILTCLHLYSGEGPVKFSEIVAFLEARYADLGVEPEPREMLTKSIHSRLKCLAQRGVVQRHHPKNTNSEGLWSLPSDDAE
jgi:hypothetical protein